MPPGRALRIALYGGDARTDALARACQATSGTEVRLFAYADAAGPGLRDRCEGVEARPGALADVAGMVRFAGEVAPDLAVIGPEGPLAAGLVDALEARGIPCFGPRQGPARVETNKSWARRLLDDHAIAGNPRYRVFESGDGLEAWLDELGEYVVKPDGLTGGKGVRVSGDHLHSPAEALQYALAMIAAHGRAVVEERMEGEELSLQTITDGDAVVHCPAVQDHKRAFAGDTGPNTGGMGSYSCPDHSLPFLRPEELARARAVNEEVIEAVARETGQPYRGVLYGGYMATGAGIQVVEINARFGDPEAMNVLAVLDTDFVEAALAAAVGRLGQVRVDFAPRATVCKYVVPEAYPTAKGAGDAIVVPDEARERPGLGCYWAGVERREGTTVLGGSRAVAFVGVGETLEEAEALAEWGAGSVRGPVRHRADIGRPDAVRRRVAHMDGLRGRVELRG